MCAVRSSLAILLGLVMALYAPPVLAGGAFKGDVISKWHDNGSEMELLEPFGYIDSHGLDWDLPRGTIIDGASIPRVLWSIIGAPFTGKYRKASVIHDFYCKTMVRPWRQVHRVFFDASLTEGNDLRKSKLMYAALFAWGPRWVEVGGVPMRIREALIEPTNEELASIAEWIASAHPTLQDIEVYADLKFPRRER